MSSSRSAKEDSSADVINPYMRELNIHPKELFLEGGEVRIKEVQGPKGEGSLEDRMEALEQEVFRYKKMAEREVDIIHKICFELIAGHQEETAELKDEVLSLRQTTNKLQAHFRILATTMSFVDGKPLPWKTDEDERIPPPPKE